MTNINEQLNQGQKEYGTGSNKSFFKFQKGDNRIRVLTAGEIVATHFFGKGQKASTCYGAEKGCPFHGDKAPKDEKGNDKRPSLKYTCYILDRADKEEKVQIADLPYSIIKAIGDYQTNTDYSFDSFPMPYDINVKYDPDSKAPVDMYKVLPSPKREEITQEIQDKLLERITKISPADSVKRKKEWQIEDHIKRGIINPIQSRKDWVDKANKEAGSQPQVEGVEYPTEEIDPNDILF